MFDEAEEFIREYEQHWKISSASMYSK